MELLNKLGIDWKLLVAQIINFFILLFVLYKFVYNPVLNLLDKRSKTIEKGISDAKKSEERLAEIERLQQERMAKTEKEIGALLDQAKKDAESMKKELMDAAALQSEDLLRRARLQIEEEKEKMIADVKSKVSTFIVEVTRKLLQREFSEEDQKRLAEVVTESV